MAHGLGSAGGASRFISGLGAALVAAGVAAYAPDVGACSGTAAGRDFSVPRELPQNAQLRGLFACQGGRPCSFPEQLNVVDSAGQLVAGELTISEEANRTSAHYLFRPAASWVLGETYSVIDMPSAPIAPRQHAFTVVAAVTLDAGRISAAPALYEVSTTLREACCEELRDSCRSPYCVALESQVELGVNMSVKVPEEHFGQWLSRLQAVESEWENTQSAVREAVSPWGYPYLEIVEQRPYYCVKLELLSLVDGTVVSREPQCVERDASLRFGRVTEDLLLSAQGISQCDYPREGIEEAWCAGVAARCEAEPADEEACAGLEQFCSDSGGSVQPAVEGSDSGGCELARGRRSAHIGGVGLLALAAVLGSAVRRRMSALRRPLLR